MAEHAPIHVIDDDEAMRDSLLFLLSSAGLSARGHESATAFLKALGDNVRGCVITDVRMPGMQGVDLVRHLRRANKAVPVIVITGHGDVPLAVEAMKAGAFDFFEKPFDDELLLERVRQALDQREASAEREAGRTAVLDAVASLTPREEEVLDGLVAGKPNKTIAYDLGISPRTVEIYRANVMTKLGAASLSQLVRMAIMAGRTGDSGA